jgi:hypothetical protein
MPAPVEALVSKQVRLTEAQSLGTTQDLPIPWLAALSALASMLALSAVRLASPALVKPGEAGLAASSHPANPTPATSATAISNGPAPRS